MLGGCAEELSFLALPPEGSALAFVVVASAGDETTVEAGPIEALNTYSYRTPLGSAAVRVVVAYYDSPLTTLGLSAGPQALAEATSPGRPLPEPSRSYEATADSDRVGSWLPQGLPPRIRLRCREDEHDDGGGQCAPRGVCRAGSFLTLDGACLMCTTAVFQQRPCNPFVASVAVRTTQGPALRPRIVDVDGDGTTELVAGGWGQILLMRPIPWGSRVVDVLTVPGVQAAWGLGVGDTDGDGRPQLIVGSWDGDLLDVNAGPRLEIQRRIPPQGYGHWGIEIKDIHRWPGPELVVSDRYGYLRALHWDGAGFVVHWVSPQIGDPADTTSKTVLVGLGDVDQDGKIEAVTYSTGGLVDVWSATEDGFTLRQELSVPNSGDAGADAFRATIGDVDGDGRAEVFYADARGEIWGLSWNGTQLAERWHFRTQWSVTAMAVGDVDTDADRELVFGTEQGVPVVLDLRTGEDRDVDVWPGPIRWVAVGDLDAREGSGKDEIAVGTDQGTLAVYRHR